MDGRRVGITLCILASFTAGCKTSHKIARHGGCDSTVCEVQDEACPSESCGKKPQEVHVHVPRQKVVVNRNAPCEAECVSGSHPQSVGASRGRATAVRTRNIEEQQIVQTRQMMLVPQQVLVPFVQTTTSGPIRVNGMSETQVMNVTGVAETTTTGLRVDRLTGTSGAVGTPGTLNAAPQETPSAAECAAQLRQYENRIIKLVAVTESLDKELRELKSQKAGMSNATPEPPRTPLPVSKAALVMPGEPTP